MAVENITLNLIPTGDTPSIHVAQFDVDRPFTVTLKEGEDDFTPTGYDIELQVRKVDNNIVTTVPTQTSGNVVTFNTTEQMTACSGTNIAELQLTKDSQTFATLHFYLVVQRDVLAGGLTSQSEIYDLEEQIAAIVPEVIGDDYYNKEEVDEKIAEIPTFDPTNYYDKEEVDEKIAEIPTFDPTNYYDKSDVNTLLNDKADISDLPDMTNYYNKSDVNALLNDKADVSDLPDMTDYYTKSEVDTKITDLYQIKTASGSIVHITDGGNAIPVKSLVSQIVAVESGSGEKSPTNPYTISGFTNGIITRCGKNFVSDKIARSTILTDGSIASPDNNHDMFLAEIKQGVTYTIKSDENTSPSRQFVGAFFTSKPTVGSVSYSGTRLADVSATFTAPITGWVAFRASHDYAYAQCEVGNEQTTYEAYNGNTYTFAFGQTVYGGHFDNKGNLVVTFAFIEITGSEGLYLDNAPNVVALANIPIPISQTNVDLLKPMSNIASYSTQGTGNFNNNEFGLRTTGIVYYKNTSCTTLNDFKTFFANNHLQICYKLANPITLAITSQDIPTLLGENNIFSNCGDVEVNYFTEKSDGIAELIKAFM